MKRTAKQLKNIAAPPKLGSKEKAQNGYKGYKNTTPAESAAYWKKTGEKVGNTKIKDIPEKTVRVAKRVGKKLLANLPSAAEDTANLVTAGYYGKAKNAMGIKKSGGKITPKKK